LEVAVPFRVLTGEEVAGLLGSLRPVRPWHSQARDPSGFPSSTPARRRDSSGDPLMGFDPSSRRYPIQPPMALRPWVPLLGFRAPSALGEERVYVRSGCPASAIHQDVPGLGYDPLTGFLNLTAACSSPDRSAIFTRMALLGLRLQGFVPPTEPR